MSISGGRMADDNTSGGGAPEAGPPGAVASAPRPGGDPVTARAFIRAPGGDPPSLAEIRPRSAYEAGRPHADAAEAREGPDEARLVGSSGSDEDRFREFVAERWVALLRTAYLLTGDYGLAEDLVQTALIRMHRHWSKIERSGSPEAYVRKVMVNLNTDRWRRFGSRERSVGLAADIDRPSSADAFASFELRDELWSALRSLPAKMRATLVLRYFEDLGEAETAQILGCSVGTVKSQTSRGLQRLQQVLSQQSSMTEPSSARPPLAAPLAEPRPSSAPQSPPRLHVPSSPQPAPPAQVSAPRPSPVSEPSATARSSARPHQFDPSPTSRQTSPAPGYTPLSSRQASSPRRRSAPSPSGREQPGPTAAPTSSAADSASPPPAAAPSSSSSPLPHAGLTPAVRRLDPR
jgi:RNA polymerase sigma-70 factor (sigma-E family)